MIAYKKFSKLTGLVEVSTKNILILNDIGTLNNSEETKIVYIFDSNNGKIVIFEEEVIMTSKYVLWPFFTLIEKDFDILHSEYINFISYQEKVRNIIYMRNEFMGNIEDLSKEFEGWIAAYKSINV